MILNDQELAGSQQRIAYFQGLLAQFRVAARMEEFPDLIGAYVAEIESMHREVMDYLTRHVTEPVTAETESASAPALAS